MLIRKIITLFLGCAFLLYITSCYRWRYLDEGKTSGLEGKLKTKVTLTSGQTIILKDAHIQGSDMVGRTSDAVTKVIPLASIHQIHIREYDTIKTAVLGTALIVGIVITVSTLEGGLSSGDDCQPLNGG